MPHHSLPKVYLAGPEVFLEAVDRESVATEKRAILSRYGLAGLDPMDNDLGAVEQMSPSQVGRAIYRANERLLRQCDAALVNLTPFRGPSADVGTVYEVGFLAAIGTPMVGYTCSGDDYQVRVPQPGRAGVDALGRQIEQFGQVDNLMIESGILAGGGVVVRGQTSWTQQQPLFDADLFDQAARRLATLLETLPDGPEPG